MNRSDAMRLAQELAPIHILEMIESAKDGITNWRQVSNNNKGMTKGTAWNILARTYDPDKDNKTIYLYNLIREFGDFLPDHLKAQKSY